MDFKKTMDKAIKACDEEAYYEFTFSDGSKYYGSESDLRDFISHLTSSEKKEYGNVRSKTQKSKEFVERWRSRAMSKLGI